MKSLTTFRIFLVTLALITGFYTLASSVAEWTSLDRPTFSSNPAKLSPTASEAPTWLQAVSPFRSDLESNHALINALQAIQSGNGSIAAQAKVRNTLSVAPMNSELWLALALLEAQRNSRSPTLVEALKMSYFVAPNEMKLMSVRLDTATRSDALSDPDLKELARGDVRLMLNRQTDLKGAVVSAYRRASGLGKAFLEEAVQSIDPTFLPTLRG